LWLNLGVVVGGSCIAVWAIFHHHVLIGAAVLFATYGVQLASMWMMQARRQSN
jgi:hypothetical protein